MSTADNELAPQLAPLVRRVADSSEATRPARAYETVLHAVEDAVLAGNYQVGDRLPAERDIAAQLGVSRTAVREAIRALETMGVVSAGVGRDGGTVLTSLSSGALTQWLRLHVMLANFPMADVVEMRLMLEQHSARLAARDATVDELAMLAITLAEMEDESIDPKEFNRLDTAFHIGIARSANNRLMAEITAAVRSSMENAIMASLPKDASWRGMARSLCREHRAILTAISAGESALAAQLMEEHIRSSYVVLGYRDARGGNLR